MNLNKLAQAAEASVKTEAAMPGEALRTIQQILQQYGLYDHNLGRLISNVEADGSMHTVVKDKPLNASTFGTFGAVMKSATVTIKAGYDENLRKGSVVISIYWEYFDSGRNGNSRRIDF